MRHPHEELPDLSANDAADLLKLHSGNCENLDDERVDSGLLCSMRSWNAKLHPANFHEVMACIKALGPTWSSEMIPSSPVSDLWSIIYLGNSYVSNPSRAEHRKEHILVPDELDVEERWLDCIGYAVMIFLQFNDAHEAFSFYNTYVVEQSADET